MKLHILLLTILTVILLTLTGCGQKYSSYKAYKHFQKKSAYKTTGLQNMKIVAFPAIPYWDEQNFELSLEIFKTSCEKNIDKDFNDVCIEANSYDSINAREFFEKNFQPFKLVDNKGDEYGQITGYYKIKLNGSLFQTDKYRYPVYEQPKEREIRSYTREALNNTKHHIARVICYVDNRYQLYLLHVQGSGRIMLDDGGYIDVNYISSNNHDFTGIYTLLKPQVVKAYGSFSDELTEKWVRINPTQADKIFNKNARYIFFTKVKHLNATGSIGIELIPEYSIAIDKNFIPIGAPVMLYSYHQYKKQKIKKLVFAHDVGAAINGKIRADYYYGIGEKAKDSAMHLNNLGNMIVFLPKNKVFQAYQKSFLKQINNTIDYIEKPTL